MGDEITLLPLEMREHEVLDLLCFSLENVDEIYAFEIDYVEEIMKVKEITPLPRSPEFILGVMLSRGIVVPVIDLRLRLGLNKKYERDKRQRLDIGVVVQVSNLLYCFTVGELKYVVSVAKKSLEAVPKRIEEGKGNFIKHISKMKKETDELEMIMILNPENLVSY